MIMAKKTKDSDVIDADRDALVHLVDAVLGEIGTKSRRANLDYSVAAIPNGGNKFWDVFWQGLGKQLITVSEAAKVRGISRISMYDLMERGRLRTIEFGGKKFLIRKEVEDFERAKPGPKATGNE